MSFSDIANSLGLTKSQAQKAEGLIKKADLDKSGTIEGSKETLELARLLAEQGGDLSAGTIKALKAQVIQNGGEVAVLYNVFGDQSGVAQSSANSTIHGIEDMVNLVNRNLGTNFTYEQLQTKEFPQPENFLPSKEKLTDNDRAVAYGEWKAAVVEWKEDIKDKLETLNEMNTRALSAQMAKGFAQTYINQGIAIDTIIQVYKELDGDMEAVKKKLDELKAGQSRISGQIAGAERRLSGQMSGMEGRLHGHMDAFEDRVHEHMDDSEGRVHGHIDATARGVHQHLNDAEGRLHDHMDNTNQKPPFSHLPGPGGDYKGQIPDPDVYMPKPEEGDGKPVEGEKEQGPTTPFEPEKNFDGGGRRLEDMSSDEVKKILKGIAGLGEKAGDIARDYGYNPPQVGTNDFEAFLRGLSIEEIKNMFSPYIG